MWSWLLDPLILDVSTPQLQRSCLSSGCWILEIFRVSVLMLIWNLLTPKVHFMASLVSSSHEKRQNLHNPLLLLQHMVVPRAGPGAVGIGPIHFQAGRDTGRPDMALDFLCFFM